MPRSGDVVMTNEKSPPARMRRRLAVLGGEPAFKELLHVGRPNLGNESLFLRYVREMLDRRWFSNDGPLVREFENEICKITGVRHCVAMCNATVALEIAARGLGLSGEVIVPAYTFVATAHCLQWQRVTPVFCDIDPDTHNIDPGAIERLITPRTTGIIGVHVWGRPCDTEAIKEIADRRGLKVMYDAAHAIGCSHLGKMIGNFGNCEIFSFHATKFINSFEGGAVVTNDDVLAEKLRLMRNFGFEDVDRVTYLGTNGKMTEVCAAMGLASLSSLDRLIEVNRSNWMAYQENLADIPGLRLVTYDPDDGNNYQYIVVEVDSGLSRLSRDELVEVLHAENVFARKYFWPGVHRMEPYRSLQPNAGLLLPNTEQLAPAVIVLPTGEAVDGEMIARIADIIRTAMLQASDVRVAINENNFRKQCVAGLRCGSVGKTENLS